MRSYNPNQFRESEREAAPSLVKFIPEKGKYYRGLVPEAGQGDIQWREVHPDTLTVDERLAAAQAIQSLQVNNEQSHSYVPEQFRSPESPTPMMPIGNRIAARLAEQASIASAEQEITAEASVIQGQLRQLDHAEQALSYVSEDIQQEREKLLKRQNKVNADAAALSRQQSMQALSTLLGGSTITEMSTPALAIDGMIGGVEQSRFPDSEGGGVSVPAPAESLEVQPGWLRRRTKNQVFTAIGGVVVAASASTMALSGASVPGMIHDAQVSITGANPDARLNASDITSTGLFGCLDDSGKGEGLFTGKLSASAGRIARFKNTTGADTRIQVGSPQASKYDIVVSDALVNNAACVTPDSIATVINIENDIVTVNLDKINAQSAISTSVDKPPTAAANTIPEQIDLATKKVILSKEDAALATATLTDQANFDIAAALVERQALDMVNKDSRPAIVDAYKQTLVNEINERVAKLFDEKKAPKRTVDVHFVGELKGDIAQKAAPLPAHDAVAVNQTKILGYSPASK
jgi:hypothetical protein